MATVGRPGLIFVVAHALAEKHRRGAHNLAAPQEVRSRQLAGTPAGRSSASANSPAESLRESLCLLKVEETAPELPRHHEPERFSPRSDAWKLGPGQAGICGRITKAK
ncbi:hypothetical protein [Streptosporangium sp. NPDC052375]|uniref:hypothetical protein n=1 Tax=Streptosporangium sp. NPDC052375 TaxID=3366195 RepID=UPI0037D30BDB